jgi:hypothetical protein
LLGTAINVPFYSPNCCCVKINFAHNIYEFIVNGEIKPDDSEKKAEKYLLLNFTTGTPFVYRYYRVFLISSIDFTPAEITLIGVLDNY